MSLPLVARPDRRQLEGPAPSGPRTKVLLLAAATLSLTACGTCGFPQDNMAKVKPGMTADQVEALLGRPTRIEQSEVPGQSLTGEIDYYSAPGGEGRVVFVNHSVFKAEFIAGAKT